MTILAALDRANEEGGWIRQGESGIWFRANLTFNRWVGVDMELADDSFKPLDLLDSEWQWTPCEDPVAGDPALVRR
jgi:hypothetical protein